MPPLLRVSLFDAIPAPHQRFKHALLPASWLSPPKNFCKFGSWVGQTGMATIGDIPGNLANSLLSAPKGNGQVYSTVKVD